MVQVSVSEPSHAVVSPRNIWLVTGSLW